jgi:protein TonB
MFELAPDDAEVQLRLADLYAREGTLDKAHDLFIAAGSAYARQGNTMEALEAARKALGVKPDSQQARTAIAGLEAQINLPKPSAGQPGTAAALNEAARRDPNAGRTEAPEFDDRMVIKHISKAELLAGYGDVEQAIALLKDVESRRPDSIDVHVKLKDIYLRNEMIEEAGQECLQIAKLYEARGDSERSMDFCLRAQRLGQVIDRPSPMPPPVLPENRPDRSPELAGTGRILGAPPQPRSSGDLRLGVETVPPRPTVLPRTLPPSVELPPPEPRREEPVWQEPAQKVATAPPPLPALEPPPEPEPEPADLATLDQEVRTVAATVPIAPRKIEPEFELVTTGASRRWIYWAAAALVLVVGAGAAIFFGLPAYEARLDREFKALSLASNLPQMPPEVAVAEEAPAVELMDVEATDVSATEPGKPEAAEVTKPPRPEETRPDKRTQEQLRPVPPAPTPAAPQPAPRTALQAPSVGYVPGARSDGAAPRGVGSLPDSGAAMPEPPPPPRPGVTTRSESLKQVQPEYPSIARVAGQKGVVTVEVSINERGDVVSARAIAGPPMLRDSATAAARRWKFKPATRDGKPITSTSTISFNFKM